MWRCLAGVVVPIPTLVSADAPLTPLILPSTSELLCPTKARKPMALALASPSVLSANAPKKELWLPVVFEAPVDLPKKELLSPVPLLPASKPKYELAPRVVFDAPASKPKKELLL